MAPELTRRASRTLCWTLLALASLTLVPALAQAESRSFINTDTLFPSGNGSLVGPANVYPSSIPVSGLSGTVTRASVTVFADSGGDDIDMVITGPNGQRVMLMSDACGGSFEGAYTFDDAGATFLSNPGPCPRGTYMPSNYSSSDPGDADPEDLSPGGGPAPPYVNTLSSLAGGSPNGNWNLFVLDDNDAVLGFVFHGWALTLEIEPPPSPPPGDTGTPGLPSNEFTIGDVNGRRLSVNVSSPGTVTVSNAGAKELLDTSSASGGPGTLEVELDLTKKAKKKLRRKGKVNVEATVTFTPTGGSASTKTAGLQIKK